MKRFTIRRDDGSFYVTDDDCGYTDTYESEYEGNAIYRLAHYEDLEEQGRLVKLPCKIGDDVFRIYGGKVYADWQIAYIEVYEDEIVLIDDSDNAIMYPADVGKTVFFSRREAEAALRKDGDGK